MIRSVEACARCERRAVKRQCSDCVLLDLKVVSGGRVVYWCERRDSPLSDAYVWKSLCRDFVPIKRQA